MLIHSDWSVYACRDAVYPRDAMAQAFAHRYGVAVLPDLDIVS